jgi:hypothetical protein
MRRIALGVALLSLVHAGRAGAGEVQLALGLSGDATSWSRDGDGAGLASLRLGYRFIDLVGIYFLGRMGYAAIDERMLLSISAGAQVWGRLGRTRPFVRVGLLHNHEEPLVAVQNQPAGALLGVGDGIRHRTGVEGGVGIDIPLYRRKKFELYGTIEATAAWLTYSVGPAWYWGGGLAIGFNYSI